MVDMAGSCGVHMVNVISFSSLFSFLDGGSNYPVVGNFLGHTVRDNATAKLKNG